ncbi:MAG TPA: hypothetical protein DCW29_10455 [Janthinobacterium sp.]|nr:hypothetical protein [Janthinobacterium sp.]
MKISQLLLSLPFLAALSLSAHADEPGRHPAYVHAMNDLREANWMVEHRHPENGNINAAEQRVSDEIHAAYRELKQAASYDGKDFRNKPDIDTSMPREGMMHRALEALRLAHTAVAQPEDDSRSRDMQHRALQHIDSAIDAAKHAIAEVNGKPRR